MLLQTCGFFLQFELVHLFLLMFFNSVSFSETFCTNSVFVFGTRLRKFKAFSLNVGY